MSDTNLNKKTGYINKILTTSGKSYQQINSLSDKIMMILSTILQTIYSPWSILHSTT